MVYPGLIVDHHYYGGWNVPFDFQGNDVAWYSYFIQDHSSNNNFWEQAG